MRLPLVRHSLRSSERDEVAGQDEEQVDAQVPTAQVPAVEEQDAGHRRPPQAIERADVAEPAPAGDHRSLPLLLS